MKELTNPNFNFKKEGESLFFNKVRNDELIDPEILDIYNNGFVSFSFNFSNCGIRVRRTKLRIQRLNRRSRSR